MAQLDRPERLTLQEQLTQSDRDEIVALQKKVKELQELLAYARSTRIVFSEPPGPVTSFVEVENSSKESMSIGEWSQEDEFHVLTLSKIGRRDG